MMAHMNSQNDNPLPVDPVPSVRLKGARARDIDKLLFLTLSLFRGISVTRELGLYLCCWEVSYSSFSPVVKEDIAPSIINQRKHTKTSGKPTGYPFNLTFHHTLGSFGAI